VHIAHIRASEDAAGGPFGTAGIHETSGAGLLDLPLGGRGAAVPTPGLYDPPVRIVLQRVTEASVTVDGGVVATIGLGLVALVGVATGDRREASDRLARKTAHLRVFGDAAGAERSVLDVGGEVLVVSQFTLLADTRRGNRPSWSGAATADEAAGLVEAYADALAAEGVPVATGRFGSRMTVQIANDGPLTILLDSGT